MEEITSPPARNARRSREEIEQLIAEYRDSGQTQRAFAAERGVRYSTFTNWLRKHARGEVTATRSWIELAPSTPTDSAMYCLEWPGGAKLRVGRGFDPGEVRALAQLMRSACSR